MPRPRKLKRNGAHLDIYEGIWNSSRSVAIMRILVQRTTDGRGRLTGAEYDYIASNDDTLAIAKVSSIPCLVQQWVIVAAYKPIGKNWPIPPTIIRPPTARLINRLRESIQGQRLSRRGDVRHCAKRLRAQIAP